jgi:hypothetical protein
LDKTILEDKCKIYDNLCKLKCLTFTESENYRNDDCFWLYDENEGEEGSCKEKDDSSLRCSEVVRGGQCTQADVEAFDGKCWWNGEVNGSGVCLSLEDEYTCGILSSFICDNYEITSSSLIVTDEPCFYNGDKNTVSPEDKCCSMSEVIQCGDIHTNGLFEIGKHYCGDSKDIFTWMKGTPCMWVIEDDDGGAGKCVQVKSCSDLTGIKNASQCSDHTSLKGNCFFNGDVQVGNTNVRCSDVVDVMRCGDLLEMGLCVYAKRDTYPNLTIDSLSSSTMYCMWDGEKNTCVSKNSFKADMQCTELGIDICDRFEGCTVVGGVHFTKFLLHFFFFY